MKLKFFATLAGCTGLAFAQGTAVSGTVTDEDGAPVANAAVVWVAMSTPSTASGLPLALAGNQLPKILNRGYQVSAADGGFQVPAAGPGKYRLCVTSLAQPSYLSTCEWRAFEIALNIADQAQTANLVVRKGAVLRFHLSDPNGRLAAGIISIIATSPTSGFAHARVESLTATQAELAVAVPFNSEIALVVDAPFPLLDGTGAAIRLRFPSAPISVGSEATVDITLAAQ